MPTVNPSIPLGSHSASINGIEQSYHVFGQGPICVALSGGPGIDWAYLRMPELERHLTMIYVEPIGTGASGRLAEHPNGYSVARYSEQVEALLSTLDLDKVLLLGHSHGGFVAQNLALRDPARLAGLLLYASSPVTGAPFMEYASHNIGEFVASHVGTRDIEKVAAAWQAIPAMRSDDDYTAVMRDLLPAYLGDERRDELVDRLRPVLRATLVSGDAQPFDVRPQLSTLDLPTLILVGKHDFICGPRWAELLKELLPDAKLVNFEKSGHFAHLEQEEKFAEAILTFSRGIGLGAKEGAAIA